jgi:hypothetical protein
LIAEPAFRVDRDRYERTMEELLLLSSGGEGVQWLPAEVLQRLVNGGYLP